MPALRRIDSHQHIVPPFYAKPRWRTGAPDTRQVPDWSPQKAIDLAANDIRAAITVHHWRCARKLGAC